MRAVGRAAPAGAEPWSSQLTPQQTARSPPLGTAVFTAPPSAGGTDGGGVKPEALCPDSPAPHVPTPCQRVPGAGLALRPGGFARATRGGA